MKKIQPRSDNVKERVFYVIRVAQSCKNDDKGNNGVEVEQGRRIDDVLKTKGENNVLQAESYSA